MRALIIPKEYLQELLQLLGSGSTYEVLGALPSQSTPAAFVLNRFGPSWGYFSTLAFCTVTDAGPTDVLLCVSHLYIPHLSFASILFKKFDRKIEDKICEYVRSAIPAAKPREES